MKRAFAFTLGVLLASTSLTSEAGNPKEHKMAEHHFSAYILNIDHKAQRYDTAGDWEDDGPIRITVSRMSNPDYEFLIAMHELVEAYLCKHAGVSENAVTWFDEEFEKKRQEKLALLRATVAKGNTHQKSFDDEIKRVKEAEPGEDLRAPYREQHLFASTIERLLASALGVEWNAYESEINSLEWKK